MFRPRPFLPVLAACALLAAGLLGCGGDDDGGNAPPANDPALTALAEQIQQAFAIADTATVLVAGPVEPGTVVAEPVPGKDGVTLELPETAGTYYVVIIDDAPERLFEHQVRYAWIDVDSDATETTTAQRWPVIRRPGVDPAPFEPRQYDEIAGVDVYFMAGENGADPADVSGKPVADKSLGDAPRRGKGKRAPVYKALVFDGGDRKGILEGAGYFGAKNWTSIAEELAEQNADPMAAYLAENDFTVQRVSQYWGNGHSYFAGGGDLVARVQAYGAEFTALGPPDGEQCDSFFLYISAHGYKDGPGAFEVYTPSGDGAFTTVAYADLLNALDSFPDHVKVTVMLDNCYGGKIISEHTAKIEELCGQLCALTLITSVDQNHAAWAPSNVHDSGTEDFMEGADDNGDGDQTVGDIQDRFREMQRQGSWLGPMSYHCPEGGSWCHLDGPTETETACAVYEGSYVATVSDVVDVAGHRPFVGEPFANPVSAVIEGGVLTFTGTDPFVTVSGPIAADCTFTLAGAGTVAGFPDVTVQLVGAFADDVNLSFSYTMGAGGELPQGEPITFNGTGVLSK